ncbi:MAG: 2-C-methyl-D-erythritol 2,4-cyclodiphosphate synthase [Candidatus Hydrogenedentota bacterium]|nr:MAG: 2-C-methyl-D-erythritol 2,4-cyclodiphosphate synthase [Candidatus Hydrogenedentota bacterium]
MRIGYGEDVHKTCPGNKVILGGIEIPAPFSLEGVSDADVVLHAVTDAILGALALGDIGDFFPPNAEENKNRNSKDFLSFAVEQIKMHKMKIANLDVTILCERPKISPYKNTIRENIARICQISKDQVSIKATTTEKLGFIGKEEGLAAKAIVLLLNSI